jgi:ribosomal protein S6
MTRNEAAIVGAYTGFLLGSFSDMHEYVEKIMGRPVFTHEMGNAAIAKEIQDKAKADYISIEVA